jgi:hypothetical protein
MIIPTDNQKVDLTTGLPDGFFSDQTSLFGHILEDNRMETVVIGIFWPFVKLHGKHVPIMYTFVT